MARVFVQPNPDGSFSTVYENNGNFEEIYRGDQNTAEQNANVVMQTRGLNTLAPAPTTPRVAPTMPATDWTGLWGSLTGSNQQQFDEARRQFNEQQKQQERDLYARLASGLIGSAANLQRPEDWLKYAEYTQGGQNIFSRLFGNTPVPTFGAPSGYSKPMTIDDIIRDLMGGGGSNNTPTTGGKTVEQMRQELYNASGKMDYWLTAPEAKVISEYTKLTGYVPPTASPVGSAMATAVAPITAGSTPVQVPPTGQGQYIDQSGNYVQTGATPQAGAAPNVGIPPGEVAQLVPAVSSTPTDMVPLPYQINPIVWDSLSDTAKKMMLSAAQAGKTPSGYWTPEDFLAQLNASRPQGIAPRSVSTQYSNPYSYF